MPSILRARSWKVMEYLHPLKKTTHAKAQAENRKINAETNSHGNKLSTRTNAFRQRQQRRTKLFPNSKLRRSLTKIVFHVSTESAEQ